MKADWEIKATCMSYNVSISSAYTSRPSDAPISTLASVGPFLFEYETPVCLK